MIAKLIKVCKDNKINIGITEKHVPDKKWMVLVLGHLSSKDEIFRKNYVPHPVRVRKEAPKVISVVEGFLKNLPIKPIKKNRRVQLNVTKTAAARVKELRLKEKKDLLRVELEQDKAKRVQNSPARQNSMQGVSFNTTATSLISQHWFLTIKFLNFQIYLRLFVHCPSHQTNIPFLIKFVIAAKWDLAIFV